MQTSKTKTRSEASPPPEWMKSAAAKMETELVTKYGESQRHRIQRGLHQVSEFWRSADGHARVFRTDAPCFLRLLQRWGAPDLWMEKTTGRPVGPEALLEATERALAVANTGR